MTYREALNTMLSDVQQKAAAYADASQADSAQALSDWEEAEETYSNMIALMKELPAYADDVIPDVSE